MSEPDICVRQWAQDMPEVHFVTVRLSAQCAADVLAVLKQCTTDHCDANLDTGPFQELVRQLCELRGLPEPSRTS